MTPMTQMLAAMALSIVITVALVQARTTKRLWVALWPLSPAC